MNIIKALIQKIKEYRRDRDYYHSHHKLTVNQLEALAYCQKLFNKLKKQYELDLIIPTILPITDADDASNYLGLTSYERGLHSKDVFVWAVKISPSILCLSKKKLLREVVLHEAAHVLHANVYGYEEDAHGENWEYCASILGCVPSSHIVLDDFEE